MYGVEEGCEARLYPSAHYPSALLVYHCFLQQITDFFVKPTEVINRFLLANAFFGHRIKREGPINFFLPGLGA